MDLAQRKADLRARLEEAQARLLAVVDRLAPDDWERPSLNEGWTVRSLFTHLASAEAGFVQLLTRMASGGGGLPDDWDPDRWNAGQLRRRADVPIEQVRQTLQTAHQGILALLDGLDGTALDQRGRMSVGGEGTTEDTFRLTADHKHTHTDDIEAALR